MYQVGVIGDRDSIIGFRALGMSVLEATTGAEAEKLLTRLVEEQYAVIFITEELAEQNEALLRDLRSYKLPAIIPIPSVLGSTGLGLRQVRESVKKAVGMDIFAQDEVNQADQDKE
ncbi:MAG: V-type ATP synthase subunit F [Eubacteriales bacterium]|nr:V-type ATP synthase subunit F [Eubacteriales bacterium]